MWPFVVSVLGVEPRTSHVLGDNFAPFYIFISCLFLQTQIKNSKVLIRPQEQIKNTIKNKKFHIYSALGTPLPLILSFKTHGSLN